jgi:small subunit ribosomal protein S19
MVEKIAFEGLLPEEAKNLTNDQYLKLIKSRQRRTLKRNSLQIKELNKIIEKHRKTGKPIRTHTREAVIMPSWVGLEIQVHNGKVFQPLKIEANMLGHRLGEFVYTTKRVVQSAPGVRATRGSKALAQK